VTAWVSRYTVKSHGKLVNPPRSATIVGTAAARMVASIATRAVVVMIATRMGPRSERKPTVVALEVGRGRSAGTLRCKPVSAFGIPLSTGSRR